MARSVLCYYVKWLDHWMRLQPIGKRLCFRHFWWICKKKIGWNEIPWKRKQSRIGFFLDFVPEFSLCLRLFISLFSDKIIHVHDEQGTKSGRVQPRLKFVTFGRLFSWSFAFRANIAPLVTAHATRHRFPTKLSVSWWDERFSKPRSNDKSRKISRWLGLYRQMASIN